MAHIDKGEAMKRAAALITVLAAMLVVVAAASAYHVPTTGTQIRLLDTGATPTTFSANAPFFVRHGWTCLPEEKSNCLDGKSEFRLYIDGQRMRSALDLELNLPCPVGVTPENECSSRLNVTDVWGGLPAGAHAFRGEWWLNGELNTVREATIDFVG
jgi:hypothetical protein